MKKPERALTLPSILRQSPGYQFAIVPVAETPGKTAQQSTLSYKQLYEHVAAVCTELRRAGIQRNHRVAAALPNSPEAAVAFIAVASCATYAPLNPDYRIAEYEFYLRDLNVTALIVQNGFANSARQAAQTLGIQIIELLPRQGASTGIFDLSLSSGIPSKSLDAADLMVKPEVNADDIALILHTSGTTSKPKIVPLSHRNLCVSALNVAATLELTNTDRCLNFMPLFHIHGLIGSLMSSIAAGSSIICAPGFHAPKVPLWLKTHQPSWYSAVPAMHQQILKLDSSLFDQSESLRLIRSSSAPLPPPVMADLERVFNVPVIEAYGMTEASHQIASNPIPPKKRKPGSVGVACGVAVRIIDDQQNEQPPGKVGEVVIRGDNVMKGYENNSSENASVFSNGWFRTGDLGYFDTDGYLFIDGRRKEIINRAGEKISPREVDEVLLSHPAVREVVTFAAPHSLLGEEVAVAVVLESGASVSEQSLMSFAADQLADFKVPSVYLWTKEIPKGPTGKCQRSSLADMFGLTTESQARERSVYKAPQTPIEQSLTTIWSGVLGIDTIGIDDNFFELGGDSMLASQVLNRVKSEFFVELSFIDFFHHPSIVQLSLVIGQMQADVLSEFGDFSDEEIGI